MLGPPSKIYLFAFECLEKSELVPFEEESHSAEKTFIIRDFRAGAGNPLFSKRISLKNDEILTPSEI